MATASTDPDPIHAGASDVLDALSAGEGERVTIATRHEGSWAHIGDLDVEGDMSPADLLALIRDRYGPGRFKITVYGASSRYVASRTVTIAPPMGYGGAPAAPYGPARPDMMAEDRLSRIERALERLTDRGSGGGDEMIHLAASMTTSMVGAIAPLLAAVGNMKQSSGVEMAKMMREGLELGRATAAPPAESADPYAGLLAGLLGEMRSLRSNPGPQLVADPPPSPPAPDPMTGAPAWAKAVGSYLPNLVDAAASGEAPEDVASALLTLLPPVVLDDILDDPDPVGVAVRVHRPLEPHRDWLVRLIAELRDAAGEPAPEPAAGEPAPERAGAQSA